MDEAITLGYQRFCQERQRQGLWRGLRTVTANGPGRLCREVVWLVNFAANDYLGLAHHPEVIRRAIDWTTTWGTGATGSRLLSGNLAPAEALESRIALAKGFESALLFSSGYQANTALLAALLDPGVLPAPPLVFADRLNHASLHQGCRAAGVRQWRYRHRDLNHLESLLHRTREQSGCRFILTETVFSMDGDQVDVAGLLALKERYGAFLYLDDAHAFGVLGPEGYGLGVAGASGRADLVMGTFSKAMGGFGAYAATTAAVRNYLIQRAGGWIYTTGLPPGVLGAASAALELIPSLDAERQRLQQYHRSLVTAWRQAGLDCGATTTPILPLIVKDPDLAIRWAGALAEKGLLVPAIRPPTVPMGTSRLRFSLCASHTEAEVAGLQAAVLELATRHPVAAHAVPPAPA